MVVLITFHRNGELEAYCYDGKRTEQTGKEKTLIGVYQFYSKEMIISPVTYRGETMIM